MIGQFAVRNLVQQNNGDVGLRVIHDYRGWMHAWAET